MKVIVGEYHIPPKNGLAVIGGAFLDPHLDMHYDLGAGLCFKNPFGKKLVANYQIKFMEVDIFCSHSTTGSCFVDYDVHFGCGFKPDAPNGLKHSASLDSMTEDAPALSRSGSLKSKLRRDSRIHVDVVVDATE